MTWWQKLQNYLIRLLIRTKRLSEVRYDSTMLNQMIVESLPHQEYFDVPGGQATLVVMTAKIELGKDNQEGLTIKLMCSIEISSLQRLLYRAHLDIDIKALPFLHRPARTIRLKEPQIQALNLIKDEYLLVKSSTDIIRSLTPSILKGVVDVTLGSALNLVNGMGIAAVKDYLNLFTDTNKQRVVDFHRPQIEKLVVELIAHGDIEYQLQADDFEEQIFADLGQQIDVDDNQLVFRF